MLRPLQHARLSPPEASLRLDTTEAVSGDPDAWAVLPSHTGDRGQVGHRVSLWQ